nr:PEPxxWA-CTERM sorting domain-containing protein [uncultured Sphingomonas sp.]
MKTLTLAIVALGAATLASPASATFEVTSGANIGCSTAPLAPGADKCAGYYAKNQFSNKTANVALQQGAVDLLLGTGNYTVDWNALQDAGKVVSGSDTAALSKLLAGAGGQVLLGLHWGNVPGPHQNVSAFYLWNNAAIGSIALTDADGYSNAVLYRSTAVAAVPEPGTWALMLLGFGAVGGSLRRRRGAKVIPQFA